MADLCLWERAVTTGIVTERKGVRQYLAEWWWWGITGNRLSREFSFSRGEFSLKPSRLFLKKTRQPRSCALSPANRIATLGRRAPLPAAAHPARDGPVRGSERWRGAGGTRPHPIFLPSSISESALSLQRIRTRGKSGRAAEKSELRWAIHEACFCVCFRSGITAAGLGGGTPEGHLPHGDAQVGAIRLRAAAVPRPVRVGTIHRVLLGDRA